MYSSLQLRTAARTYTTFRKAGVRLFYLDEAVCKPQTTLLSLLLTARSTRLSNRRSMASNAKPAAQVKSIDHIVLTVADIDATKAFYGSVLGMASETFTSSGDPSTQRHALSFGSQKINLHLSGKEFEPKASNVQPGSGDLCFITDVPVDQVLQNLKDAEIDVLEGGKVVDRTGAVGKLRSVYIRDPDGNLVEISNYD